MLGKAKQDRFVEHEMVADKDTEGTATYCSNHSAKILHKNLEKKSVWHVYIDTFNANILREKTFDDFTRRLTFMKY